MLRMSVLSQIQQHWTIWLSSDMRNARATTNWRLPTHDSSVDRYLYEFRHVEVRHLGSRHLGSWGRYICYTPGRRTSWTGYRYHLAWNVGTITSSAVSWTSSTRNIRNECECHMAKHSRSIYCMSCTGHPWDINSVVSMQSPLPDIWLLLRVLRAR
jgi:hypothetical protein